MTVTASRLLALLLGVFGSNAPRVASAGARMAIAWYPNGRVMYRRSYVGNYEEGTHRGWWSDGTPHFVYRYVHGRLEGEAREWFPNGALYRDFHYLHGQESGAERMWYPDGTLRANYVMVNGRRFGLPGAKGCVDADSAAVSR